MRNEVSLFGKIIKIVLKDESLFEFILETEESYLKGNKRVKFRTPHRIIAKGSKANVMNNYVEVGNFISVKGKLVCVVQNTNVGEFYDTYIALKDYINHTNVIGSQTYS